MANEGLFDNVKYCDICRRVMPIDYGEDICPSCEENELFNRVKEFIRNHDVTEYDVVEEFKIPIRQVKTWIKEGRIEYKELETKQLKKVHCIECGGPIQFGVYCQKCYKLKNAPKYEGKQNLQDQRMRFLE